MRGGGDTFKAPNKVLWVSLKSFDLEKKGGKRQKASCANKL